MPSVLDHPAVGVVPSARDGTWSVVVPGGQYLIREWTWGERRRLVDLCADGAGGFDGERFAREMVALIVEPDPGAESRELVAAIALRLLGVAPGQRPLPLLEAEASFARAWGFGPRELDRQPALRLDQQLAHLPAVEHSSNAVPAGWTSIVVAGDH